MPATKSRRDERREKSAARRRAEQHKSGFQRTSVKFEDDVSFVQIKADTVRKFDILPYKTGELNPWADPGSLHYELTYFAHRGIGPDQMSYVCPAKTAKKRCPICEYIAKESRKSTSDPQELKALQPKERQLFNVIDIEDREKGVQVLDMSYHNFGKCLDNRIKLSDDEDGYDNFSSLSRGLTLKVGFAEESMGGNSKPFAQAKTIDFRKRSENYDKSILKEVHDLEAALVVLPYDKLKQIFLQVDEVDDDEDSETEDGTDLEDDDRRRDAEVDRIKANKKKKSKPADDEDEDEPEESSDVEEDDDEPEEDSETEDDEPEDESEVEDEEEDDEEPPPKKKVTSKGGKKAPAKKAKPQEDDDDDDWDADWDEDDEPAPKKKKR